MLKSIAANRDCSCILFLFAVIYTQSYSTLTELNKASHDCNLWLKAAAKT